MIHKKLLFLQTIDFDGKYIDTIERRESTVNTYQNIFYIKIPKTRKKSIEEYLC